LLPGNQRDYEKNMHVLRNILFLFRTVRLVLPGSRYRRLSKYSDPNYVHERDKHTVRYKHYRDEGWEGGKSEDGIQYRNYESYDEYVEHQRQKILEILKINGGFSTRVILRQRYDFWKRFRDLDLSADAQILCLGARFGTEVEVLRDLGYRNALGFDLEPGPENPFVVPGDFMNIDRKSSSIDMIFCNAVDHAFDLAGFFKEHARILKPSGLAIYDVTMSGAGVFEAVQWENEKDLFALMLGEFSAVESVKINGAWKTIHLRSRREYSSGEPTT